MSTHTFPPWTYNIGQLNAFQQFSVARSLYSVITTLGELERLAEPEPDPHKQIERAAKAMCGAMTVVDARTVDEAVQVCLACVSVDQKNGAFAPLVQNGMIMFQEVDLPVLMQLVYLVLRENKLISFFAPPPAPSQRAPATTNSQESHGPK